MISVLHAAGVVAAQNDFDQSSSSDPAAGFAVLVVFVLLIGAAITGWKVSTARRIANESGMDPNDATKVGLLTDDGVAATYLAANLRARGQGTAPEAENPGKTLAERLRELESLRAEGLVSEEEYAAARRKILDRL